MLKIPRIRQPLGVLCLLLVVLLGLLMIPVQASSNLESRLATLEFDNLRLRSRVDQLESQITGVSHQEPRSPRGNEPIYPLGRDRRAASADPRVDQLATLAVELKERVTKLEAQVAKLSRVWR